MCENAGNRVGNAGNVGNVEDGVRMRGTGVGMR